jgi:hypothetical protein
MPVELAAEKLALAKIQKLGCALSFLSVLSGVSKTRISEATSGIKPLDNAQAVRLVDTLTDLEALVERAAPIPISLTNPKLIQPLLDAIREERFSPPRELNDLDLELLRRISEKETFAAIAASFHLCVEDLLITVVGVLNKMEYAKLCAKQFQELLSVLES